MSCHWDPGSTQQLLHVRCVLHSVPAETGKETRGKALEGEEGQSRVLWDPHPEQGMVTCTLGACQRLQSLALQGREESLAGRGGACWGRESTDSM